MVIIPTSTTISIYILHTHTLIYPYTNSYTPSHTFFTITSMHTVYDLLVCLTRCEGGGGVIMYSEEALGGLKEQHGVGHVTMLHAVQR